MDTIESMISRLERFNAMIDSVLDNEVTEAMKEAIAESVLYNVYDYSADATFKRSRRWTNGGIADSRNIKGEAYGGVLTLTDIAGLQNLWGAGKQGIWSADVATLVQNGSSAFNQPGSRPFLDEAVEDAINSGKIDAAIQDGLRRFGFDVD